MQIFLVIFLYAAWSSVFTLGKWTLGFGAPLFLTACRMLFAGALLVGYAWIKQKGKIPLTKMQIASFCLLGVFSIYLTNSLEFWGLQHLSAAKTCFIYSLSPFFSALFSYIHFGEKMNGKKWIGMVIGFCGFLPVLSLQSGEGGLLQNLGGFSLAELAVIAAAIFSVYGWVLLRLLVKEKEHSPLIVNGFSMLFGGMLSLIHSLLADSWTPLPLYHMDSSHTWGFLQGVISMTLISNILCYNLYGYLLKKYSATFLSFMGLLSPIFASFTSWIFLGESLSPIVFVSTGVLFIGLFLLYQEEKKQGYVLSTKEQ